VALAQGTAGGVAFYLVDLESPVLWGLAMALCSFLPVFGTGIVWVPAVIFIGPGGDRQGNRLAAYGSAGNQHDRQFSAAHDHPQPDEDALYRFILYDPGRDQSIRLDRDRDGADGSRGFCFPHSYFTENGR
jgi:hypothetical protein